MTDPAPYPFTADVCQAPNPLPGRTTTPPGTSTPDGYALPGNTPGLYVYGPGYVDKASLITQLTSNTAARDAWLYALNTDATVGQTLTAANMSTYINSLYPVVSTRDIRVTNWSWKDGAAVPYQNVLVAGTTMLVDTKGIPRTRCQCGNPLTAPNFSVPFGGYVGGAPTGFDPVYISDAGTYTPTLYTPYTTTTVAYNGPTVWGTQHIPVAEITPTQWRFKQTSGLFAYQLASPNNLKFYLKVRCSNGADATGSMKNLWDAGSWTAYTCPAGTYGSAIRVSGVNYVSAGSSVESSYSYTLATSAVNATGVPQAPPSYTNPAQVLGDGTVWRSVQTPVLSGNTATLQYTMLSPGGATWCEFAAQDGSISIYNSVGAFAGSATPVTLNYTSTNPAITASNPIVGVRCWVLPGSSSSTLSGPAGRFASTARDIAVSPGTGYNWTNTLTWGTFGGS